MREKVHLLLTADINYDFCWTSSTTTDQMEKAGAVEILRTSW